MASKVNGNYPSNDRDTTEADDSEITEAEIRKEFGHHDLEVARINNGSFGSCPATVIAAQRRWQMDWLEQPDRFYFHSLRPAIRRSRAVLATLVNAGDPDHLSLLDNATTAVSLVLHSLSSSFSPGDTALLLHCSYGAVKNAVHAYVSAAAGRVVEARLPFPASSPTEIVASFKAALATAGGRVRLAVVDHVTSMPSVVLPAAELVRACREAGVERVLVDGAHGVGCVDVDVEAIGADYYTSNLHKWMFCPPSVAFLHHAPGAAALHHPVVSHERGKGLPAESAWVGTRDYSPQLVIPDALRFLARFPGGLAGVRRRNRDRAVEMGRMLADAWGTHLGCPPEMCSSMVMVGLPECLGVRSDPDALRLRAHLREAFRVEVPIYYRPPEEEEDDNEGEKEVLSAYARISHQVYNQPEDYYRFRDAVACLVETGFTCASLAS